MNTATEPIAIVDDLIVRSLYRLHTFTSWLREHRVPGVLGEFGWPADPAWTPVATAVLDTCQRKDLAVYGWSAGALWQPTYPLGLYVRESDNSSLFLSTPTVQGRLFERYLNDTANWGVNLNGAEFGIGQMTDGTYFSNQNPGQHGRDFLYPCMYDFQLLRLRGIRSVRLAVRWERLQGSLGGELRQREVNRLRDTIIDAQAEGVQVVLCLFGHGDYLVGTGLDNTQKPDYRNLQYHLTYPDVSHFINVWERLTYALCGLRYVVDLCNEPRGHRPEPHIGLDSGYSVWHAVSSDTVQAIRESGNYTGTILVPGAEYSGVRFWSEINPTPWIDDPNVRYEAHFYLDDDGSGSYAKSAAEENALAVLANTAIVTETHIVS